MEDLNCSTNVNFNTYPDVSLKLDFKLALMNEKEEDSIKCREYQINGVYNENTYCYLRYKIIEGEIQDQGKNIPHEINVLCIKDINIDEDFRKQGLATKMYQLLSDIYMQNYSSYKINRKFVNPYAEYAFRKAVQEEEVDKTLLHNSKIEREYEPSQKEILKNLMQQLSPEYRDEL